MMALVQSHGRAVEPNYTAEVQAARAAHLAAVEAAKAALPLEETLAIKTARIIFQALYTRADAEAKHAVATRAMVEPLQEPGAIQAAIDAANEAEAAAQQASLADFDAAVALAAETASAEKAAAASEAVLVGASAAVARAEEELAAAVQAEARLAAEAKLKAAIAARAQAADAAHFDAVAVAKLTLGPAPVQPTDEFLEAAARTAPLPVDDTDEVKEAKAFFAAAADEALALVAAAAAIHGARNSP